MKNPSRSFAWLLDVAIGGCFPIRRRTFLNDIRVDRPGAVSQISACGGG